MPKSPRRLRLRLHTRQRSISTPLPPSAPFTIRRLPARPLVKGDAGPAGFVADDNTRTPRVGKGVEGGDESSEDGDEEGGVLVGSPGYAQAEAQMKARMGMQGKGEANEITASPAVTHRNNDDHGAPALEIDEDRSQERSRTSTQTDASTESFPDFDDEIAYTIHRHGPTYQPLPATPRSWPKGVAFFESAEDVSSAAPINVELPALKTEEEGKQRGRKRARGVVEARAEDEVNSVNEVKKKTASGLGLAVGEEDDEKGARAKELAKRLGRYHRTSS